MSGRGYAMAAAGALLAFSFPALPSESGSMFQPVVYQDQYITVRSSIAGVEDGTHHLGDVLTAYIKLEYDPRRVRTLNLDETLLEQAGREVPGINLQGAQRLSIPEPAGNRTGIEAEYDFQLLGCPDGSAPPCPGGKVFSLPDLSLGIELIGDDGRAVSSTPLTLTANNRSRSSSLRRRSKPSTAMPALATRMSMGACSRTRSNSRTACTPTRRSRSRSARRRHGVPNCSGGTASR